MSMVLNRAHSGFRLSRAAALEIARRHGITLVETEGFLFIKGTTDTIESSLARNDEHLVEVVREMGDAAGAAGARLRVVEVDCTIEVTEDEGFEDVSVYGGLRI